MSRKWRLALILGLLAILLGYLFVGNSLKNSSHCGWKEGGKKMHKQAHDMNVKKTKKASQFMAGARDQVSSINKIGQDEMPEWYAYLLKKDYSEEKWDNGMNGMVMTRKTVTPHLLRYAQLHDLDIYENDGCQFDDISDESEDIQSMIETVCKHRLLRGKNGSYLKNDIMTQTDMLVLLMRSKYGYLNENAYPWFKNYYNKAVSEGIVKPGLNLDIFSEELTLKDVSLWMQRMHKENDASRLLSQ